MAELPAAFVDTIITSPPYYGVRDYGHDQQLGAEADVEGWVNGLRDIARDLARVLRPTGSLWLNLGDSYSRRPAEGAAPKSLLLGPSRVALALVQDGWTLRNEVIWAKTNPMPSSVADRLTTTHELIYFFTRSPRYYFDPIRQPLVSGKPYDPDTRWSAKADVFWNGYKVHISETCGTSRSDEDSDASSPPNLITNVATTDATVADMAMTASIHQGLQRRDLLPAEHYVDSGYATAELIVSARELYGLALVAPVRFDSSPQARAATGYGRAAFTIDWTAKQATCPQGQTSSDHPARPGHHRGQILGEDLHALPRQDRLGHVISATALNLTQGRSVLMS